MNIHKVALCESPMAETISEDDIAVVEDQIKLEDNGGRRISVDRRSFSYSLHIPERRSSHNDRRKIENRRKTSRIESK